MILPALVLALSLSTPEVAAAQAAMDALQQRLSARLVEEMKAGGPRHAVTVCRDEAPAIAADVAREHGLRVGRTSHRLRNPGNEAPEWARSLVAGGEGRTAASTEMVVIDLPQATGVLRPIGTAAACLRCHGPAEQIEPEVRAFLAIAYPEDRAVGFAEGDLRGFFWAEVPRPGAPPVVSGEPPVMTGEELFGQTTPRCTICHNVAGRGNANGPSLDGVGQRLTRDEIADWIREPKEMARQRGSTRKPAMVPYPEFSDEELAVLVEWLAKLPPAGDE